MNSNSRARMPLILITLTTVIVIKKPMAYAIHTTNKATSNQTINKQLMKSAMDISIEDSTLYHNFNQSNAAVPL